MTAGSVTITWLRQAGFLLEGPSGAVLIDAFLSDIPGMLVPPAVAPEDLVGVDVVLATHEHGDHLDLPAWTRIGAASSDPVFVVPEPLRPMVEGGGISGERIIGARVGTPIAIGDITIEPVPACHGIDVADAYTFGFERSAGLHRYVGYVVHIEGVSVYHAGDTILYPGMEGLLSAMKIDVALLPINGRDHYREQSNVVGNLHPREAAQLAAAIDASLVIPMHYDTAPGNTESPAIFVDYLRRQHPKVSTLLPGNGASFTYSPPPTRR